MRNKLIEITEKIRDINNYQFTEEDLDFLYEILHIEDPASYGFQHDETYFALYIIVAMLYEFGMQINEAIMQ